MSAGLERVRRRRAGLGFRKMRNSNGGTHTNPVLSWRVKKSHSLSSSSFRVVAEGQEAKWDG